MAAPFVSPTLPSYPSLRGAVFLISPSMFLFCCCCCCCCSFQLWNKPHGLNVFMIWWLRAPEDTAKSLRRSEERYTRTWPRSFVCFVWENSAEGFQRASREFHQHQENHRHPQILNYCNSLTHAHTHTEEIFPQTTAIPTGGAGRTKMDYRDKNIWTTTHLKPGN